MRIPKRNGDGTVFVMGAIDLVMAARGCDYEAARKIIYRIFKDYCNVDLEAQSHLYKVQFSGKGQRLTLALDVQGAAELLCVIPDSDFGVAVRCRAVDALFRIEGGDESLIDRIKANRKFQEYLAQHDPDHPMRAIGEHAERRQVEEAVPDAHRREEMKLVFGYKKRTPFQNARSAEDNLYIMQYSFDKNTVKIGRSFKVEYRRRSLESCHNFGVRVVKVFPNKGKWEKQVHRLLHVFHSRRGRGVEWFRLNAISAVQRVNKLLFRLIWKARIWKGYANKKKRDCLERGGLMSKVSIIAKATNTTAKKICSGA
jgi:hypothetical protein